MEGTLTSYSEVFKYLLRTYATGNFLPKMDGEILRSTQPSNMTPTESIEALRTEERCSDLLNDEYVLKGIFIESLHRSIINSMCLY